MARGPAHGRVQVGPRKNRHSAQKPTDVQDPVPGPAPPPALQLLVLRVLQAAVVKQHADDALGARVGWWGRTVSAGHRGAHGNLP